MGGNNLLITTVLVLGAVSCFSATTGRRPGQTAPVISTANTNEKQNSNAVIHEAFIHAGKKPGLEIWRIENFQPIAYPKSDYGKFHSGDSYIILFTKEKNGILSWDLHFWLGQATSQDESGAAAALTVQLDNQLGGTPVQYREVQYDESQLFKSHFKNGLQYLQGGVASGFRHVDNTVEKKLYKIKGKRNVRVRQVEMSIASMNKGDCFILDNGNTIYVYVGEKSKSVEKLRAVSAANLFRDTDHRGRSKVIVIDQFSSEDEVEQFFKALGFGSSKQIPDESIGGDDEEFERNEESIVTLYKVSDSTGKITADKITEKPIKQEMLNSDDCFILDPEHADIYVWIGKKCNAQEKSEAMNKANNLISSKKYPSWTRVQRVVANTEPSLFRLYFKTWKGVGELHSRLIRNADTYIRAYHCKFVSDGKSSIHQLSLPGPKVLDAYHVIILDNTPDVYVWNGKNATPEEKHMCLEKAKKIFELNNKEATGKKGYLKVVQDSIEFNELQSLFSNNKNN